MAARRDDHLDLFGCEQFSQRVRIIAFIAMTASKWKGASNDSAWERSWRSPPVKMNCKGKPSASTRRWILLLKPPRLRPRHCSRWCPLFWSRPRRTYVGAYSCTVGHDRCHVRVLRELFEHVGPNTVLFPANHDGVALEDTVPLAKVGWQFTPLCAGAQNPVNCFDETATLFLLPCIGTRVSLQKCVQFLPLMVGNPIGRHPTIVAILTESIKRQRDLVSLAQS